MCLTNIDNAFYLNGAVPTLMVRADIYLETEIVQLKVTHSSPL